MMLYAKPQRQKSMLPGILVSFLILGAVLVLFVYAVNTMQLRTDADQLTSLTNAIQRASVQCYAIEGRYPPSVEYLEEHYGLLINHGKYNVFYDGWASNVMPDITVLKKDPSGRKGDAS